MNTNQKREAIAWINENIETLPEFAQEIMETVKARYQRSIANAPKVDPRKAELQELVRKARAEIKALSAAKISTAVKAATEIHKAEQAAKEEVVEAPVEEAKPAPKVTAKK